MLLCDLGGERKNDRRELVVLMPGGEDLSMKACVGLIMALRGRLQICQYWLGVQSKGGVEKVAEAEVGVHLVLPLLDGVHLAQSVISTLTDGVHLLRPRLGRGKQEINGKSGEALKEVQRSLTCLVTTSGVHHMLATFLALTYETLLASARCQVLDPLVGMLSWSPGVILCQLGEAEALLLGVGAPLKDLLMLLALTTDGVPITHTHPILELVMQLVICSASSGLQTTSLAPSIQAVKCLLCSVSLRQSML